MPQQNREVYMHMYSIEREGEIVIYIHCNTYSNGIRLLTKSVKDLSSFKLPLHPKSESMHSYWNPNAWGPRH